MDALVQRPFSVAMDTDSVFFQLYLGGEMQFWCGTNHGDGVLVVSHGTYGITSSDGDGE